MNTAGNGKKNAVAIVGMSCIFPGAPSLSAYWENIVNGVDAVREPGKHEWDSEHYKNKSKDSFGKIYCSKAGFITEYAQFNPLDFGIMPASLRGADPDQFLALRAAADALRDAGYDHKSFDGEKAEIVVGRTMAPGVGSLNLIQHGQTVDQIIAVLKAVSPQLTDEELTAIERKLHSQLQPCNADTIPAVMPNILSGRIASKLGFKGRNLVLDAACASSLIAVEMTMQSLLSGKADLAIAGGVHINSSPYFTQMFCELGALSTTGTIRPFDDKADGTILGEGVGMVVLKRLEDAERDNNKIYAVIRGIGSSSDGRGTGSLAPSAEGEALAMRRAYEMSGLSPRSIELLEAHGTGTAAGDLAEMKAIELVFGSSRKKDEKDSKPWCALGSVKSMIGHTQAASGIAGLIKTTLALHNKTLPPTLHFNTPSKQIQWDESPCYVITKAREWNHEKSNKEPRRAAVSAFGFGGINAHAVLEEYSGSSGKAQSEEPPKAASTKGAVNLTLTYPELSGKTIPALESKVRISPAALPPREPATALASAPQRAPISTSADADDVLRTYMQTMNTFQQNALQMHEKIMLSYLTEDSE